MKAHQKPLTIALVSDSVLPFHNGGKEARIDHLAKALVQRGHDVHIYTMKWWNEPTKTCKHSGITYHAISKLYPLYNGERRSFKEGIMFGLACFRMVRYRYDVLEADHMPYFPLFSIKIVSLLKRKPFFATWHEAVGLKAWQSYIGTLAGTVAYVLEHVAVRMPNHLITVSERTNELVQSELGYKGKKTLVVNGIDYATIAAAPKAKHGSDIVYAGRLVHHKHVDMLLRAVAQLKETRPAIRATIIGTGPELKRLQKLAAKLGLENNVTFTGRLEHSSDVFSYMKASKVFVSPSSREGFGITVLEAYACGIPVVTVNHPDNAAQYLVRDGAGIVCDLSPKALADSIETVLAAKTKLNAHDAERFDWSHSVDALLKAYTS